MHTKKRIWQIQGSTVCKVVGMALTIGDLRKIARKFGLAKNDPLMDEEFALHTAVVQFCSTENAVSKHLEKLVEKRFAVRGKKLRFDNPPELIETVRCEPESLKAPLWAVLWGLATRGDLNGAAVETALFGHIHMLEHRLVREFWDDLQGSALRGAEEADSDAKITQLKRELLDMQTANKKLEKMIEKMRIRLVESESVAEASSGHSEVASKRSVECANKRKARDLKMLLAEAKQVNDELTHENELLKREIEALSRDLYHRDNITEDAPCAVAERVCPCPRKLAGKTIALVGGIESLEPHYRDVVESLGGAFCRHDGACANGDRALQDCINGSDLVVCPIEVNSHNAAKSVKRICKARGVPCVFPKTASIAGLKRALDEHSANENIA